MKKPKIVVGHLMNDELFVKSVTISKSNDWLKWLEVDELVEFFEELLKLVTQISEDKESAKTLSIFLADWRETALINSEPDVLADIFEAEQELDAPWIDIAEGQREQKSTIYKTYAEPDVIDITEEQRDAYLTLSIFEIPFSVRIHNCLESRNIETVRDLVGKTEKELLLYKGLGRGSMRDIKEKLAVKGLWLGMDLDDEDYEEDENIYEEDTE